MELRRENERKLSERHGNDGGLTERSGIRVPDPRPSAAYAPSDSARLLLNIGTMPYEGPVMPFLRPYHL